MIKKIKLSDLAKDLNITSKELVEVLQPYCDAKLKTTASLSEDMVNVALEIYSKKYEVKNFDDYFSSAHNKNKKTSKVAKSKSKNLDTYLNKKSKSTKDNEATDKFDSNENFEESFEKFNDKISSDEDYKKSRGKNSSDEDYKKSRGKNSSDEDYEESRGKNSFDEDFVEDNDKIDEDEKVSLKSSSKKKLGVFSKLKSTVSKKSASKSKLSKKSTSESDKIRLDELESDISRLEGSGLGVSKSKVSKKSASKSDKLKSNASKSGKLKSNASKSDVSKSNEIESDISRSNELELDISRLEGSGLGVSKSKLSKKAASKSGKSRSNVSKSDISRSNELVSDVSKSNELVSGVSKSNELVSDVSKLNEIESDVLRSNVLESDVSRLSELDLDILKSDEVKSDISKSNKVEFKRSNLEKSESNVSEIGEVKSKATKKSASKSGTLKFKVSKLGKKLNLTKDKTELNSDEDEDSKLDSKHKKSKSSKVKESVLKKIKKFASSKVKAENDKIKTNTENLKDNTQEKAGSREEKLNAKSNEFEVDNDAKKVAKNLDSTSNKKNVGTSVENISSNKKNAVSSVENISSNKKNAVSSVENISSNKKNAVSSVENISSNKKNAISSVENISSNKKNAGTSVENISSNKKNAISSVENISSNKKNAISSVENISSNKKNAVSSVENISSNKKNVGSSVENISANKKNAGSSVENISSNKKNVGSSVENISSNKKNAISSVENILSNKKNVGSSVENISSNKKNVGSSVENISSKNNAGKVATDEKSASKSANINQVEGVGNVKNNKNIDKSSKSNKSEKSSKTIKLAPKIDDSSTTVVTQDVSRKLIDTKSTQVNLDKYNERYENMAGGSGYKEKDNFSRKQKFKKSIVSKNLQKKDSKAQKQQRLALEKARNQKLKVSIPDEIVVSELALRLKINVAQLVKKLMDLGVMAKINDVIDFDTAAIAAQELGAEVEREVNLTIEERLFEDDLEEDSGNLQRREPIVVVMGHVDHGKTSLLDKVCNLDVTSSEAGGITQKIGAYKVRTKTGTSVTFLDTPGHEAFTSMRMRGANMTDIAVLVVAADDGIMPQTVEAINHAKAADVSIIVAINKIDKPQANVEKIKQELMAHDLVAEEWGGDVICVPVSAKTGEGIDQLLEMIDLVAEVKDLKANANRCAKGTVIEAYLDRGRGPVATLLVQNGTLKVGDSLIAGTSVGHVRTMLNDRGKNVKQAGPSTPVEVTGLSEVPLAGEEFNVISNEKLAKELVEKRKFKQKQEQFASYNKVTLENLFNQIEDGERKEVDIIVKADVQGSVEALKTSFEKLSNEEVKVKVIHGAVGAINKSDVMLAIASNAIVVGFNVRPDSIAKHEAEENNVDLRRYSVIYDAITEMEQAIKGMLAPKTKTVELGEAEVRQTYKISNVGTIAGCFVVKGKVQRSSQVRLFRDGVLIVQEEKIASLKRFKDDVKEVANGYECGIGLAKFNDIKVGDVMEFFSIEKVTD